MGRTRRLRAEQRDKQDWWSRFYSWLLFYFYYHSWDSRQTVHPSRQIELATWFSKVIIPLPPHLRILSVFWPRPEELTPSGWTNSLTRILILNILHWFPQTVAPESSTSTAVVSALQGSDVTVRCTVFAYPLNVNYWIKDESSKARHAATNGLIESGRQRVVNDP